MVQSGVLEDPPVDAIFALHSWPDLATGQIGYKHGVMFAGTDSFKVVVRGRGGHAAHPHKAIDPIVMAAKAIDGFQTIVSRVVSPLSPTVLTVGRIEGGTTHNVIPEYVTMEGTIRTLDREVRETVISSMKRILDSVAVMYSAPTPDLQIIRGTPSLNNDKDAVDYVAARARSLLGPDNVVELRDPSMGGEDFAYYLDEVPGAMYRLGVGSKSKSFLHTSTFDFDDGALQNGITVISKLALDFENGWSNRARQG
jgi:amidohydrolase